MVEALFIMVLVGASSSFREKDLDGKFRCFSALRAEYRGKGGGRERNRGDFRLA